MSQKPTKKSAVPARPNYIKAAYVEEKQAQFRRVKSKPAILEDKYEVVKLNGEDSHGVLEIIKPTSLNKPQAVEEPEIEEVEEQPAPPAPTRKYTRKPRADAPADDPVQSSRDAEQYEKILKKIDEYQMAMDKRIEQLRSEYRVAPQQIEIKMPEPQKKQISHNVRTRIMRV